MWWSSKFTPIVLLVLVVVAVMLVSGTTRTARATENTASLAVNSATSACSMPMFLVSAARDFAPLVPFRVQFVAPKQPLSALLPHPSWLDQFSLFRALQAQLEAPKPRITFVPSALNRTALQQDSLNVLSLLFTCMH